MIAGIQTLNIERILFLVLRLQTRNPKTDVEKNNLANTITGLLPKIEEDEDFKTVLMELQEHLQTAADQENQNVRKPLWLLNDVFKRHLDSKKVVELC